MKSGRSGRLEYRFDPSFVKWNDDRAEALGCALIREFREMDYVGFRFASDGSVSLTRLDSLEPSDLSGVINRAEGVYRHIMRTSRMER
jgi:hypothetical protein